MSSSRLLDGTNQYLAVNAGVITDYPFTVACWAKTPQNTATDVIISIADIDNSSYHALGFAGAQGGDPVVAWTYDGSSKEALTSSGYSVDTWHHCAAVFTAADNRASFIDGGSKGTNAVSATPATPYDNIRIGVSADVTPFGYFIGNIALVGIWNIALSDADIAELAGGALPTEVQAGNLVAYWFDGTEVDTDHKASFDLTPANSPTWDSGDFPIVAPGGIVVLRRRRM